MKKFAIGSFFEKNPAGQPEPKPEPKTEPKPFGGVWSEV